MRIDKNVFLVTGGASGLGEAVSRMIAAGGGRVVDCRRSVRQRRITGARARH